MICFLDDILITGTTEAKHDKNLEEVLKRLQDHGVRLKQEKCSFYQKSVEYLGHCISADGVHTTKEKTQAILDAREPKNVQELQSFLELLNYYARFIPNVASMLHPLHKLLQKHHKWQWTRQCSEHKITSAPVLAHFDPALPIVLAGDASAYGVEADFISYSWVRKAHSLCISHTVSCREKLCTDGKRRIGLDVWIE